MSQMIIEQLGLQPHPEGGYYRRTYESPVTMSVRGVERPLSTAIYYFLGSGDFAGWRRIQSDEMMHYYAGATATVHILNDSGQMKHQVLGPTSEGAQPQVLVPAQHWSAVEVDCQNAYVLMGCTVTPGFVFEEFELGDKTLAKQYSEHKDIILRLIREPT